MNHRQRELLASGAIVGIFLLIQLGALAMVEPFEQEGFQEVEDTSDPSLSIVYLLAILVVTALMLAAIKYDLDAVLRLFIILSASYIVFVVFEALLPATLTVSVGGTPINIFAWGGTLVIGGALLLYPEWYVIDAAGILMGIGASAIFGINFGTLPVLVLLVVLAVYDAISVYGTEHMLTLASGVMDMRVPVLFVVPLSLSYTFLDDEKPDTVPDEEDKPDTDVAGEDAEAASANPVVDPDQPLDAGTLNELGPAGIRELDPDRLAEIELDEAETDALDESVRETLDELGGKRDALFIGLGDAVIPTALVASAAFFIETGPTFSAGAISVTLPALTAMIGMLVGLVALLWLVHQGRAHAGLPLLNGGTIAGYLLGALASGLTLVEALGLSSFV